MDSLDRNAKPTSYDRSQRKRTRSSSGKKVPDPRYRKWYVAEKAAYVNLEDMAAVELKCTERP